jgi:hypothetical protein
VGIDGEPFPRRDHPTLGRAVSAALQLLTLQHPRGQPFGNQSSYDAVPDSLVEDRTQRGREDSIMRG